MGSLLPGPDGEVGIGRLIPAVRAVWFFSLLRVHEISCSVGGAQGLLSYYLRSMLAGETDRGIVPDATHIPLVIAVIPA